jgi:gas vesicle protein
MDNLKEGITTSLKIEHIKEIFESVFETNIPVNVFRSIYKKQYINNDLNLLKDMTKKFVDHIKKQQKDKIQQNNEEAQNNILMTVTKRLSSLIHYLKNLANRPDTSNISLKLNFTYKEIIKLIAIKKIFECTTLSPEKKLKYSDIIEYNTKTKKFSIRCEDTNDIEILQEIF